MEMTILSKNLRLLREKAGLTQKDVADRLALSDKTVSKWENARSVPDIFILLRLSKIFECSLEDFVVELESLH